MIFYILFFLHLFLMQVMIGKPSKTPKEEPIVTAPSLLPTAPSLLPTAPSVLPTAQSNQLSYPLKTSLVSVIKGDVVSIIVDGKDMTEEVKKLMGYSIGWNYGKLGENWTNELFQFDPSKGEPNKGESNKGLPNIPFPFQGESNKGGSNNCSAVYLLADGTLFDRAWGDNRVKELVIQKPFVVLEARYGISKKKTFFYIDVTRHFQLGMKMLLSDVAIKIEKDPTQKTKLAAIFQTLKVSKNILLMKKGETAAQAITFDGLLQGWPIETTCRFPGDQPEQTLSQNPGWKKVLAVDKLLSNPLLSITKVNPNRDKERASVRDLPTVLKVVVNENKLLDVEANIGKKKKSKNIGE